MQPGLVSAIFNRDIHSLTEEDLSNYFSSEKRETNTIEFKSYIDNRKPGTTKDKRDNEKLDEIIKTICGFLNSDRGILIWGAPKGKSESGNEEVYKGALTPRNFPIFSN
jgi:predicted HTH transcriptional regulator